MPLTTTHFCFCSAPLCLTWHHPHIYMSMMSLLTFPAYTAFLSSCLVSLVGCFKEHSFNLDISKINLKNSIDWSLPPILFFLCSLVQGKAPLSICLCKPWNLGFVLDTPFSYIVPNPFCFIFQILLIVCLLFYVS